jgi:predicted kinase
MAVQQGSVNVRVTKQTHRQLAALALENGLSMQTILDQAVEAYRRQSFLEALNADFAALKAQPEKWADEQEERKIWEQTLADGLESL